MFFGDPIPTGHVAIVHSATPTEMIIIEQNGETGNGLGKGYDAINFQAKRNYKNCLGWYHKK